MGKELPHGTRLGPYAIERLLVRSGLSDIYVARQVVPTERPCRLTLFHADPESESWQRFTKEVAQLKALEHPGIAEVREVAVTENGTPYLVHFLPDGEDLSSRLRRSGALTTREALSLARQAAAVLHAAHSVDLLHRDLQPDNLFLVARSRAAQSASDDPAQAPFERLQLLGFGHSRMLEAASGGTLLAGNPEYMAPEQLTSFSIEVGPAADQYTLALVLYQALTASRPFRSETVGGTLLQVVRNVPEPLRALRPDIPAHIEAAVMRALSKDRFARFPSLPAFIDALQGGEAIPEGLAELTDPWLKGSARADAAQKRARALDGDSGGLSMGGLALGLGGVGDASVPEMVEDGATVPNSMESVMRLAVPPERIEVLESTAPVEISVELLPPSGGNKSKSLPGVAEVPSSGKSSTAAAAAPSVPVATPKAPAAPSLLPERTDPTDQAAALVLAAEASSPGRGGSALQVQSAEGALTTGSAKAQLQPRPSIWPGIWIERILWLIIGLAAGIALRSVM